MPISYHYEDRHLTVYGSSNNIRQHIVTLSIITLASLFTGWMLLNKPFKDDDRMFFIAMYYSFCFLIVLFRSPQHVIIYTKPSNNNLNIRGNFKEGVEHQEGPAEDFSFHIGDQYLTFEFKDKKPLTLDKGKFSKKGQNLIVSAIEKAPTLSPESFNQWLSREGLNFRTVKKSLNPPDYLATMDDYAIYYRFSETSSYLIWQRVYFGICGSVIGMISLIGAATHS
ncbi:hypothetical protein T9A_01875 [Alcanivorax jadensis T9]|uniref:Transmembrane protein n=1 Tax=Alcanivorax jadensis T9 TaxID=1177181 RepID=A0ABR4WC62_9GAMM|nr:hypothetical protein [Alcanivorax jadensis]KGD61015.1 hypothetical protein T9A_01875 [Alcanivorax jadensis T9]MBP22826.1 hypothetical protein [Alcanivorax sp.]|tara:strand:- start:813 stop:1487 length:675 start_codon:yes stop_codon:yes gene_type:complete